MHFEIFFVNLKLFKRNKSTFFYVIKNTSKTKTSIHIKEISEEND